MHRQVLESAKPWSDPPARFSCDCVCFSPVPVASWLGLIWPHYPPWNGQPDSVCLRSPESQWPLQVPPLNAGKLLSRWVRYKCAEDFLSPIFTPRAGEKGEKMRRSRKKTLGAGKTHPSRDLTLWSLSSSLQNGRKWEAREGCFFICSTGASHSRNLGFIQYAKFAWHRYYNNNKLLVTSTINLNTLTKWQMSFL